MSKCVSCPFGYSCLDPTLPPVPCISGTYSSGGNSSCLPCPAGKSCIDPSQAPITCPVGTYSPSVGL